MTHRLFTPACLALTLAFAGVAQAGDSYYIDGYRMNCPLGDGAEGIMTIGPGWLNGTETHYERISARKTLPGGWQRATWTCMAEGVECGRKRLDLHITPAELVVRDEDGVHTARRCPA